NAALAATVLWIVRVVVATFVDDQGAATHILELQVWRRHRLVDALGVGLEDRKIALVAGALGSFVRFLALGIEVRSRCAAGCHLAIRGGGSGAVALLVQMETVLARSDPGHGDLEADALLAVADDDGADLVA